MWVKNAKSAPQTLFLLVHPATDINRLVDWRVNILKIGRVKHFRIDGIGRDQAIVFRVF
jgi:hypothetical protein